MGIKRAPYFVCKFSHGSCFIANLTNFGIYVELSNDCLGNIISILDMSDRYHTWPRHFIKRPDP